MEVTINILAPELAQAINNLAAAIGSKNAVQVVAEPTNVQQSPQQDGQQAGAVPGMHQPEPNTGVGIIPTASPQYTLEMIAKAGTALVDAGKMDALRDLLAKYQVDAITALNPSQYGVFATELRALGAQI